MNRSEFASDHTHGVQKELVGIDVRFEGGLVHQNAHGKMRHHQSIEFLTDQVRGFAFALVLKEKKMLQVLKAKGTLPFFLRELSKGQN